MTSYIQVLKGRTRKSGDELATGMLQKAGKQAAKMTKLINGFLSISRLESCKIHIERKHFDLADLIKETEEEMIT